MVRVRVGSEAMEQREEFRCSVPLYFIEDPSKVNGAANM